MIIAILVIFALCVTGVVLVSPKVGALLLWPIIFVYPHLYMERLGLLPWNAGVDDVFICLMAAVVLMRRNLLGGVPLRFGLTLVGALTYYMIWVMAQFSGWYISPELQPVEVLKPILKGIIFVLYAFVLVHTIDDERDVRRMAISFAFFMTAASCTVILHRLFPGQFAIFSAERFERLRNVAGEVERGVGSLMSPNTGAALLAMSVLFAIHIRHLVKSTGRLVLFACIPVLLLGMVYTGSRTGGIALGVAVCWMAVASRSRFYAWGLCGLILFGIAAKPDLILAFWERLQLAYNPDAGEIGETGASRLWAWQQYIATASPQAWLFGEGQLSPLLRIGLNAHSTYVAALFYHGVLGLTWLLLFFGVIIQRGFRLARCPMDPYRSIGSAVLWSLLIWAIAGIAIDMLVSFAPHFTYLFFAAIIERSYALAKQRGVLASAGVVRASPLVLRRPHANRSPHTIGPSRTPMSGAPFPS